MDCGAAFWVLLGFDIFLLFQLVATWFWFAFKMEDHIKESAESEIEYQMMLKKLELERWLEENWEDIVENAKRRAERKRGPSG